MRISKKAEYALRAPIAMARPPARSWAIHELAASERIPIKFLEQILLALRRGGILNSKRGVGGGYTLVRPPDDVRLGEIVAIFDDALAPIPAPRKSPANAAPAPTRAHARCES